MVKMTIGQYLSSANIDRIYLTYCHLLSIDDHEIKQLVPQKSRASYILYLLAGLSERQAFVSTRYNTTLYSTIVCM